jgi:hypothetical protein
VKGHGGAKAAVRRVATWLRRMPFVMRTDVRRYYASVDPVAVASALDGRHRSKSGVLAL